MKIKVGEPSYRSSYVVEVHGFVGDAESNVEEIVYVGESEEVARFYLLQAEALSQAFPHGRVGEAKFSYAMHAMVAQERLGDGIKIAVDGLSLEVWDWVADGWSWDHMSEVDATINGSRLWRFDEHGAKRPCGIEWSPEEQAWLDDFGKPNQHNLEDALFESAKSLAAFLLRADLDKELALGAQGKAALRI